MWSHYSAIRFIALFTTFLRFNTKIWVKRKQHTKKELNKQIKISNIRKYYLIILEDNFQKNNQIWQQSQLKYCQSDVIVRVRAVKKLTPL